ncbi:hypothetical protein EV424DRAFT_1611375 [Suillus variegatus]|nr:hypothetical protein EV424DRAFT_1611375 [Suillus variegatus]
MRRSQTSKTSSDAMGRQQEIPSTLNASRREMTISMEVGMRSATPFKPPFPIHEHSTGKELAAGACLSNHIFGNFTNLNAARIILQSTTLCRDPPKRRGRYALAINATTINSRFTISKEHNHGVDFQYDEVVKSHDGRKQMLVDDCECCCGVCVSFLEKLLLNLHVS